VTGNSNALIYNNKINLIDNIMCTINGICHGIYRAPQGGKHQYHEIKIELGMVSESLIYRCSRAIRKSAIPEQVLEKQYCFSKTIGSVITT